MDIPQVIAGSLTDGEMTAAIHLAGFVLAVTELLKRIWRRIGTRYYDKDVWFISSAVGVVGAWFLWPPDSNVPFWIAGLIGSGLVSFAHRYAIVLVEWKFPDLAAILTGDRRKGHAPPPDGEERRGRG